MGNLLGLSQGQVHSSWTLPASDWGWCRHDHVEPGRFLLEIWQAIFTLKFPLGVVSPLSDLHHGRRLSLPRLLPLLPCHSFSELHISQRFFLFLSVPSPLHLSEYYTLPCKALVLLTLSQHLLPGGSDQRKHLLGFYTLYKDSFFVNSSLHPSPHNPLPSFVFTI